MPIDFNPCTMFRLRRNGKMAIIIFRVESWSPFPKFMIEDEDGKTGVIPYKEIGEIDWDTVLCLPEYFIKDAKRQQIERGVTI